MRGGSAAPPSSFKTYLFYRVLFTNVVPGHIKLTFFHRLIYRLQSWAADQPAGELFFLHFQRGVIGLVGKKMAAALLGTMCTAARLPAGLLARLSWREVAAVTLVRSVAL